MDHVLTVKNLETSFFTYDGEVEAVRNISFGVKQGTITGVIGESGCGKSVTALSILKLLSNRGKIKSGEIWFKGRDLVGLSEKEMLKIRGNQIAMVFQNSMTSLDPLYTIGNQMAEVIAYHKKTNKQETQARCLKLLEMVGIPDPQERLKAYPHQLSGGMRQRVGIALALSCEPALLLADEPTTALDVTLQVQILGILRQMTRRLNTAVLLITHDLSVVANTCSRVIVMYGGKIMEEGSTADIFARPLHPYTQGLLKTVRDLDGAHGQKLFCINGAPPQLLGPPAGCPFARRCPYAMNICKITAPGDYGTDEHRACCWRLDEGCPEGGKNYDR